MDLLLLYFVRNCVFGIGEVRVASRDQEIMSVASQSDRFKCFSCVPKWPLQVYQLRPELSTPSTMSCVLRLVRNSISSIESYGCTKYPTFGRALQFYCTLLYTQLNADIQNCWMISTTELLYHGTVWCLSPIKKNFGEEDRHIMFLISPISSYCYDLMKTLSPERVLMQ